MNATMGVRKKPVTDISTEEKIKEAARAVFHRKGYAATRTRDIAEESGINLALLNYYFRSKEKLFQLIVMETMQGFFKSLSMLLNDERTPLETKVQQIVNSYVDMLLAEPHLPGFIINELRNHPEEFFKRLQVREVLLKSAFAKQYNEAVSEGEIRNVPLIHFIMSLMGLIIFPFVVSPLFKYLGGMKDKEFRALMLQRKQQVPEWVKFVLTKP